MGDLPYRARERDVEELFDRFGRIKGVSLKNGFGFVEFGDDRDAAAAVRELDGRSFMGKRLIESCHKYSNLRLQ